MGTAAVFVGKIIVYADGACKDYMTILYYFTNAKNNKNLLCELKYVRKRNVDKNQTKI